MLTVKYRKGHREENINWDASKQTRVARAHGGTVQCKKDTEVSDVFFWRSIPCRLWHENAAPYGHQPLRDDMESDPAAEGNQTLATRHWKLFPIQNARKCFAGDSTLSSTLSDVLWVQNQLLVLAELNGQMITKKSIRAQMLCGRFDALLVRNLLSGSQNLTDKWLPGVSLVSK